jgi:hypothetical protein
MGFAAFYPSYEDATSAKRYLLNFAAIGHEFNNVLNSIHEPVHAED